MDIYKKLNVIQTSLNCTKSQTNAFGKYKYRSLEDINEAVKPLLKELQLVLIFKDEPVQVSDRVYIKTTATLIDAENPAESIDTTAYARESLIKKGMDDSQITGATSSYARKYCANGLFCIDDTKDADTMDNSTSKPKNPPKSSFLKQMEEWSVNEKDIYWEVMGNHKMKSATAVKNPVVQKEMLQEMSDILSGYKPI